MCHKDMKWSAVSSRGRFTGTDNIPSAAYLLDSVESILGCAKKAESHIHKDHSPIFVRYFHVFTVRWESRAILRTQSGAVKLTAI
jgi:hypothetical protein